MWQHRHHQPHASCVPYHILLLSLHTKTGWSASWCINDPHISGQSGVRYDLTLGENRRTGWSPYWCINGPYTSISARSGTRYSSNSGRKFKDSLIFILIYNLSLQFRPEWYQVLYNSGRKYRDMLIFMLTYKWFLYHRPERYQVSHNTSHVGVRTHPLPRHPGLW